MAKSTIRYKAICEYDGTFYNGFQRQKNSLGIQEVIEKAIKNMTRQVVTIQSSGRTDKGVHAKGQVFHFDLDTYIEEDALLKGLNKRLPLDIKVLEIKEVSNSFHSRYSAKSKRYKYYIAKNESSVFEKNYEVYIKDFDLNKIKNIEKYFIGTKDFAGFAKKVPEKETTKTIYDLKIKETKTHYIFIFHGNSFLRYMIRSIMGTIIDIATDKKEIDIINEIFTTKDRSLAGKTAEARGLYLDKVYY